VFSTDQVEEVVERSLAPTAATKIVICTSTCDPDRIAALGARVAQALRFLEVPVSGTSTQVRQGDGVGLIGGEVETAQIAAPVLDALIPTRFHIGKIGDGGRAKLAINLILGLNRLALAEGLVFASRLDLDPAAFLQVARASAAGSQVMDTKGPKMVAGDFAPEGRVRQTLKDVHLMRLDDGNALFRVAGRDRKIRAKPARQYRGRRKADSRRAGARRAQARRAVASLAQPIRAVRPSAYADGPGATISGRTKLSTEIAGRKMTSYIDWIAPTFLVTLASLPAASVPCGQTAAGLPIGLQIIGPRFAEPKILGAAKLVHEMNPTVWPGSASTKLTK
jgi:hypothetical protein